jgi:hypothetical protein
MTLVLPNLALQGTRRPRRAPELSRTAAAHREARD